jgi:hypothetical protein
LNGTATGAAITVFWWWVMTLVRNDGYSDDKIIVQGSTNVYFR